MGPRILLVLAGLLGGDAVVTRTTVYTDDDRLTVIRPQATGRFDVARGAGVDVGWAADVISAATIDVRTAASPRGYHETRQEVHVGPRWELRPGLSFNSTYDLSQEPDYRSQLVSGGGALDVLARRLTLSLAYRYQADTVGRHGDPGFARPLNGHGVDASAALVVDRRTLLSATYAVQRMAGFMASPYRFVEIDDPTGHARASIPERVPALRWRHAVALDARRALSPSWFLHGSGRVYADDWSVRSFTAEAEIARTFSRDRAEVGVRGRGYAQTAADFRRERYGTFPLIPRYATADKTLGRTWSALAGVRGDAALWRWGRDEGLRVEGSVDLYHQRFLDFSPLPSRQALVVSAGASASW